MGFIDKLRGSKPEADTAHEDLPDMQATPASLAELAQQAKAQEKAMRAREAADVQAAENEGLPSVNRRHGSNKLVTLLGFVFILGAAAAMIAAVNRDKTPQKKPATQVQDQVANRLPPIVIPPEPIPIRVATSAPPAATAMTQPAGPQVPAIRPGQPGAQPIALRADGKPAPDWTDRKLGGNLLVDAKSLALGTSQGRNANQALVTVDDTQSLGSGDAGRSGSGAGNDFAARLEPTITKSVAAGLLADRNFLITKGTTLDCALETALDSSVPGMTTCRLTRDIYSDNGQVLLLDRGSQLVGEYQGGIRQGQARLFVLWSRAKTPNGVVVNLNSPGTDALGRSGLDGWVDNHFAARFGAAILFSFVKDTLALEAAKQQTSGGTVVYSNTQAAGEQMVGKILDSTINIPPTLFKNQGDHIQVMIARDLDFAGVYRLQVKQ